jgi:hypothetical protein
MTSGGGHGTATGLSFVAQAPLDRWALPASLIGRYNDAVFVDILERLEAANVGSGKEEEVTLTQVINELICEW